MNLAEGYDTAVIATTSTLPAELAAISESRAAPSKPRASPYRPRVATTTRTLPACPLRSSSATGPSPAATASRVKAQPLRSASALPTLPFVTTRFRDLDGGVAIKQLLKLGPFKHSLFQNNSFIQLTQFGVRLTGGAVIVDTFSDNLFSGHLRDRTNPAHVGTGLLVEADGDSELPQIRSARRNHFVNNDIGIRFYELTVRSIFLIFISASPDGSVLQPWRPATWNHRRFGRQFVSVQ